MRARVAYISSLGTTTILVCAALLILAVGSALVAFRGWPGGTTASGVQRVTLGPDASPRLVVALTRAAAITRVVRSQRPGAAAARLLTAGLVKQGTTAPGPVVRGIVKVTPGSGAGSVTSPPGVGPPAPTGSPFQVPPPAGSYYNGPTGPPVDTGVPVPAPDLSGIPGSSAGAVTGVAGGVVSSVPPPPVPSAVSATAAAAGEIVSHR